MHYDQSDLGSSILIRNIPKERNLTRLPSSQFLHETKAKKKKLAEKSTFSSSQLDSDPFKKMYFVAILDSGPLCYECIDPVTFEECAEGQCIFNDGKCYYSGKQQDPYIYNKYGCIQPRYCNKTVKDGNVIHCCEGSLCNKG